MKAIQRSCNDCGLDRSAVFSEMVDMLDQHHTVEHRHTEERDITDGARYTYIIFL